MAFAMPAPIDEGPEPPGHSLVRGSRRQTHISHFPASAQWRAEISASAQSFGLNICANSTQITTGAPTLGESQQMLMDIMGLPKEPSTLHRLSCGSENPVGSGSLERTQLATSPHQQLQHSMGTGVQAVGQRDAPLLLQQPQARWKENVKQLGSYEGSHQEGFNKG